MSARQTKVLECAKSHIGSNAWALYLRKTSADGKCVFNPGEYKCNLFVYEMLVAGGVAQDLPNKAGTMGRILNSVIERPFCASEWHAGKVPQMKLVGCGADGLNKSWPGDIVTDGNHVGIISGPQKTISASAIENKIVENNWGWRKENWPSVKVFRYHP